MNKPFIVIGGGIGGLQIAALLSRHSPVIVYEKTHSIGGRARVIEKEGFLLDWGAHPIRFGSNSSIAATMTDIGHPVTFVKPGPIKGLLSNGSIDTFPAGGLGSILKSKMAPKFELLKLVLKIKKFKAEQIEKLFPVSLQEWMEQEEFSQQIQRYLTMISATTMVSPFIDRVSAGEMIDSVIQVLKKGSAYYPKGGWESFFKPLQEKIKGSGGIVHLGKEVTEIVVENQKATGVIVDGEFIAAKAVINAVPIQGLFNLLDSSVTEPEFVTNCRNLRQTAGIAIDFCLSKPVTDISGIMMMEEPLGFGFCPSSLSPEIVPAGKSLMTFFSPTNVADLKDSTRRKALHQKLRKSIISFFPEIETHLEFERPLFLDMVDGRDCSIDQHRLICPGNNVPNVENLWLTGDSAGGHGAGGDIGHTSVRECYKKLIGTGVGKKKEGMNS